MFDPARSGLSRPSFVLPSKTLSFFLLFRRSLTLLSKCSRVLMCFFSSWCIHKSHEIWQLRISPVERRPDSRSLPFILSTWEFWTKCLCLHGAKITITVPQMQKKNFLCIAILSFHFLAPCVHFLWIYHWSCPPFYYCIFFLYVTYFLPTLNTAAKQPCFPLLTLLPPKQ